MELTSHLMHCSSFKYKQVEGEGQTSHPTKCKSCSLLLFLEDIPSTPNKYSEKGVLSFNIKVLETISAHDELLVDSGSFTHVQDLVFYQLSHNLSEAKASVKTE